MEESYSPWRSNSAPLDLGSALYPVGFRDNLILLHPGRHPLCKRIQVTEQPPGTHAKDAPGVAFVNNSAQDCGAQEKDRAPRGQDWPLLPVSCIHGSLVSSGKRREALSQP